MAARAATRAREQATLDADAAAQAEIEREAEYRASHPAEVADEEARINAGPPCRSCYELVPCRLWYWKDWWHVGTGAIVDPDGWDYAVCTCPCHPAPMRWDLVALA